MIIIIILTIILSAAYLLVILTFTIGWNSLEYFRKTDLHSFTNVSILIAARNEENNIESSLKDILSQDYPHELFEIIVVDDNSIDRTNEIVNKLIIENPSNNIKLLHLETANGKKQAISLGIDNAEGELIITTDADCRMGKYWLSTIVNYYETKHPKMIIGPVCFQNEKSLFQKFQSLEFLSLIGITAGSASLNTPMMCNGANLAFERSIFYQTGGFANNNNIASGDDMFLMMNIASLFPASIHFLKNYNAVVYTEPKSKLNDFLSQRKRWVSKTRKYFKADNKNSIINLNSKIMLVAVIVYLLNLIMAVTLISGIFFHQLIYIFIFLFIIKSLIDYPILEGITEFMGKNKLLRYFVITQFLNIFYVSIIGIAGSILKYEWKERTIKN